MANRWERGKLGPYSLPTDFTTGGVALNGINNVTPAIEKYLIPAGTLFYAESTAWVDNTNTIIPSGQNVSRTAYPELFSLLGVSFGVGDGINTFGLPFMEGMHARSEGTAAASGIKQIQVSELADHTHTCVATDAADFSSYDWTYNHAGLESANQPFYGINNYTLVAPSRNTFLNRQSVTVYGSYPNYQNSNGTRATDEFCLVPYYTTKTTTLPIGAIIGFVGNDSLTGLGSSYLLCNGQAVNGATYPNAAALGITSVPDLRGRFLTVPGVWKSTVGAAPTGQQTVYHTHKRTPANDSNLYFTPLLPSGNYNYNSTPGGSGSSNNGPMYQQVSSTSVGSGPATETRPINMNVNFFMRLN